MADEKRPLNVDTRHYPALNVDTNNLAVSDDDDDVDELKTPKKRNGGSAFFQSFPRSLGQRPLIDYVKNNWSSSRSRRRASSVSASQSSHDTPLRFFLSMISAPKFRRYVFVYFVLVASFYVGWTSFLQPVLEERAGLVRALDLETMKQVGGWFGTNTRPVLANVVPMMSLDPALIPASKQGGSGDVKNRRLIFVGDVHGCRDELEHLLKKVSFDAEAGDHVIFTGDMIHKGPDSPGVVDLAREIEASCVRGNHEDRILLLRSQMKNDDTFSHPEKDGNSNDVSQRKVARELTDEQASWLQDCPVILKVGHVSGIGDVLVVHGGVVPGVALERQDLSSVMTMRTIDLDTHVPSASKKDGVPWFKLYNKYQELLFKHIQNSADGLYGTLSSTTTIIYGHDAAKSLNIQEYTKGLDSGCVYGKKLSALVISNDGEQEVVQVKCKKYAKS